MAQATYTVPSTAVYRSDDGTVARKFYEGAVVPIETAVYLNMPDAVMPAAGDYFSDEEQAAIREIAPAGLPQWRSGLYYGNDTNDGTATYIAGTIFANMLYAVWCEVPETAEVNQIGTEITTLVATKKIRLAAYAPDGTQGYPGSLIVESAELGTDATGAVTDTIAATLSAGGVWLSMQGNDSTIAVRQVNTAGRTSAVGKPAIAGTNAYGALVIARTFGAFPATFPASAVPNASAPVINVRAV